MVRPRLLAVCMALAMLSATSAEDKGVLRKQLIGNAAPELTANAADWLAGSPTSLQELRGRVVWLQFNF